MKLLVATPAYGGQVNVHYMTSILKLQRILEEKQIGFEFFTIHFDSLIPRARNACVSHFLKGDASHMIFIDADVIFDANDVLRMLMSDKALIAGVYSKKCLDIDIVNSSDATYLNVKDMSERAAKLNLNIGKNHVVQDGIMEVDYVATGFMMISKKSLTSFVEEHPDSEYINDIQAYGGSQTKSHDIFRCGVVNKRYLSEDYFFCHLWRQSGRKVNVNMNINLGHVGSFTYYSKASNMIEYKH